ncbi:UNVERIFIED_CONTAM: Methylesterase 10 [Sesamum calycinum]|uniref:Methylesterase 10 n=1 Tax=Sesamum calycinum TaxID=2727403 RepID=A0AAW2LS70_9LAMI
MMRRRGMVDLGAGGGDGSRRTRGKRCGHGREELRRRSKREEEERGSDGEEEGEVAALGEVVGVGGGAREEDGGLGAAAMAVVARRRWSGEPLLEFLTDLPAGEKVVLVGHSMGGGCISLAMEKFPHKISVAVFVTALMPGPEFPLTTIIDEATKAVGSYMDIQYFYGNGRDNPPTSYIFGPKFMATRLYDNSPPKDLTLGLLLVRPMSEFVGSDLSKEVDPSKENYGSVRRVFVVCDQDNSIKPEIQKWMIESNPPDGVKVLHGADHMAMFSRPHELCAILRDIAAEY